MSKVNGFGKPLKRLSNTTLRAFSEISVNNISAKNLDLPFLSGNILTGVEINDSLINSTIIGNNSPADGYFSNITIGQSGGGLGGSLIIYSNTVGNSVVYNPNNSTLDIQGNLIVSSQFQAGNLRIIGNNLEAINTNGNVSLVPNGTGIINFEGSLYQNFNGQNYLQTSNSQVFESTNSFINVISNEVTELKTYLGDINLTTDISNNDNYIITNIEQTSPGIITITTSTNINLKLSYSVLFSATNSNPVINGSYNINSIVNSTQFTILGTIFSNGNSGNVKIIPTSSINLNSKKDIKIPVNIPLIFGINNNINSQTNSLELTSENINLNGDNINIQNGDNLNIGSSVFSNTSTILDITQQNININSRLNIKNSSILTIGDYISDGKDRGTEYKNIISGNPNLLFSGFKNDVFTVYKQAINNSDVITGVLANAEFGNITTTQINTNNIFSDPDLFLEANRDIYITPGRDIIIPSGKTIKIGNSEIENITNNLTLSSNNIIFSSPFVSLSTNNKLSFTLDNLNYLWYNGTLTEFVSNNSFRFNLSSGSVFIPQNIFLTFGTSNQYIVNSGFELNIASQGNINLYSSTGSVFVPASQKIIFGSSQDYISGNSNLNFVTQGDGLFRSNTSLNLESINNNVNINSLLDINLSASGNVAIPNNISLYLGVNNIKSNLSDLIITSTGIITLNASTSIYIPLNKNLYFGTPFKEIKANSTELQINSNDKIILTSPSVDISGDLSVSGNITYITSTVTTITDPVIQLGSDTVIDNFDRGISYLYNNGSSKKGFFGLSKITGRFTFIPDATENTNIFSGLKGDLDIKDLYASEIISSSLTVSQINGNPDIIFEGNGVYFNNNFSQIESGAPIYFGGINVSIQGNNTTFTITSPITSLISSTNISLSSNSIIIPLNNTITLGNQSISNNSNNLTLTSNVNINLTATNTILPTLSYFYIGNSYLRNENSDLTVFSTDDIFFSLSGSINIPTNTRLNFSNISNYIYSDSSNLILSSNGNISLQGNVNISGNIISGIWNGSVISTTYGGTGKNSWISGSIVFANSTQLIENNSNFFWDNSNFRLGLGSNLPEFRIHIQNDHILFKPSTSSNNIGLLFKNSLNNYCIRIYKPQSPTNFNDLIISTGNEIDYLNLLERLRILDNGFIGINANTRNDINERLYVNGNIKTTNSFKFDDNNYINNNLGVNIFSSTSLNLNPTSQVFIQNNIPLVLGTTSLTGSGNNLNITNTGSVNITNSQLNIGSSSINTMSGNLNIDPSGDINLLGNNINISSTVPLNIGNSYIVNNSSDLNIVSISDILLSPSDNILIQNNKSLYFGNSYIYEDLSGNLILNTSSSGDLFLSPSLSNNIFINDNTPLVFGDFTRRIVSDGTKLNIYGLIDFNGDVNITGDLTVSGSITSVNTISADTDANILIVGQRRFTIIDISLVSGTIYRFQILSTGNHNLVSGDTCYIQTTGTVPLIANTYTISNIATTITIDVDISVIFSNTGTGTDRGLVRIEHTQNLEKDLGIQFKWHTGTSTGTTYAKNGFFGYDESTGRFTFIKDGVNTNDVFSGTKGYVDILGLYLDEIRTNGANITFYNNTLFDNNSVSGSNFQITGGNINGTVIGNSVASSGTFSTLNSSNANLTGGSINGIVIGNITPTNANFTSISVTSSSLVTNLNADLLDNKHATDFIWRDGTQTLTGNWNVGNFKITVQDINLTSANSNCIIYSDTIKDLKTSSNFTFISDTLTVPKINGFENTGTITNVNIVSGNISGTNIDVSLNSLTLANGQIDGSKISGTATINIIGNATTVTDGIYTSNYSANSILKADSANTPISLTVPEETIIGRKTGGFITALTPTEARTLIGVDPLTESNIDNAGGLVKSGGTMTGLLNFSVERIDTIGGNTNIDISVLKNITYISVTGTGISSGTIPVGNSDGQFKIIIISSLDLNCGYDLIIPSGRILFADGTTTARSIRFNKKGQSLQLFYDSVNLYWVVVPSGFGSFV